MKIALLVAGLLAATQAFPQPATDAPLITNGPVTVTAADFEAFLLRVPEKSRPALRASMDQVGKTVELVYGNRVLAGEARKAGLDRGPDIQLRLKQIEEAYLAQLWTENFRKSVVVPDLTKRAEELYRVNQARYEEPAQFNGRFILLLKEKPGRTREQTLALANEIRAKAVAGARFEDLMDAHTEDPNFGRNLGRFQRITAKDVEKPVFDAAFATRAPGEITPPVELTGAVIIVRVDRAAPARTRPFEAVKREIIEQERERILVEMTERRIGELKNTPDTRVHSENISALRVEMPVPKLEDAVPANRPGPPTR